MLWVEYESSDIINKQVVTDVVHRLSQLVFPHPVAAEDQRINGLHIIAYDSLEEASSSEDSEEFSPRAFPTPPISTTSEDIQGILATQLGSKASGSTPTDAGGCDGDHEMNAHETVDSDSANEKSEGENERGSGSPNGDQGATSRHTDRSSSNDDWEDMEDENGESPMIAQPGPSVEPTPNIPAIFIGRVNIKTRDGYQQVLEVAFEPVISAQIANKPRIENTICMESVNVTATRMSNDKSATSQTNAEQDGLPPYFVTDTTTITVGVSGGSYFGPRKYSPKQSDFLERQIFSQRSQGEVSLEISTVPKGSVKYIKGGGTSSEMKPISIGLLPRDFGSGRAGCKRWQYKVLESYKTNMECSRDCPPIHQASFMYDCTPAVNFPDYLHAQVKTEFKLAKRTRFTVPELRRTFLRSCIRHISVRLEARIKRGEGEDYFQLPAPNKKGAILEVTVEFDDVEIGRGIPRTARPCAAVEADFFHEPSRKAFNGSK